MELGLMREASSSMLLEERNRQRIRDFGQHRTAAASHSMGSRILLVVVKVLSI